MRKGPVQYPADDSGESGVRDSGTGREGSRHSALETAARAATAIVVFGIPLAVGTATVLGYGAYSLYKRLRTPKTGK